MKTTAIVNSCKTIDLIKNEFSESSTDRTGSGYIKKFKSTIT